MSEPQPDPLRGLHPENRAEIYAKLHRQAPIYWSAVHSGWVLSRYADVAAALRSPDALALDPLPFLQAICQRGGFELGNLTGFVSCITLLTRPPRHDAVRRVLAQALAATREPRFAEFIRARADTLLGDGAREGSIDLAGGFARAIALSVVGDYLGIPDEDMRELAELGDELTEVSERLVQPISTLKRLDACAAALTGYFTRLVTARRRSPGNDGTSLIIRLADETIGCEDRELAGTCAFFFVAAQQTTAVGISSAALMLLENDALRQRLTHTPSLIPRAATELLRLASPLQHIVRQFRTDQEIAGQEVRADEPLILLLGAANRDPVAFPCPDMPDLDRAGPESLAFAAGPYRCVGAQLASMELEAAMRALLDHPELRLSAEPPVWSGRMNVVPLTRLMAEFG
jgi:cytochrome P450